MILLKNEVIFDIDRRCLGFCHTVLHLLPHKVKGGLTAIVKTVVIHLCGDQCNKDFCIYRHMSYWNSCQMLTALARTEIPFSQKLEKTFSCIKTENDSHSEFCKQHRAAGQIEFCHLCINEVEKWDEANCSNFF